MRGVVAVVLLTILGACSGEPEIYGIYDLVSISEEALPTADVEKASIELRPDGASVFTFYIPSQFAPVVVQGSFSSGVIEDGCLRVETRRDDRPGEGLTGSICGDVFTADAAGTVMVLHKRR